MTNEQQYYSRPTHPSAVNLASTLSILAISPDAHVLISWEKVRLTDCVSSKTRFQLVVEYLSSTALIELWPVYEWESSASRKECRRSTVW